MNKNDKNYWLKTMYPLTIICDRYGGTYSGGVFLAFPCDYYDLSEDIDGDDVSCMFFWDNFGGMVGKGNTPQKALDDLIEKIRND